MSPVIAKRAEALTEDAFKKEKLCPSFPWAKMAAYLLERWGGRMDGMGVPGYESQMAAAMSQRNATCGATGRTGRDTGHLNCAAAAHERPGLHWQSKKSLAYAPSDSRNTHWCDLQDAGDG
ncbi:hypothetical protein [Pseudomonas protegens]|uniref:hypothetical protein n=1 Tax=Pseudomonas protegens TaxID=380021 RepID=UPI00223A905C|nr:hypothetical protein [Pseudomonas protegens]